MRYYKSSCVRNEHFWLWISPSSGPSPAGLQWPSPLQGQETPSPPPKAGWFQVLVSQGGSPWAPPSPQPEHWIINNTRETRKGQIGDVLLGSDRGCFPLNSPAHKFAWGEGGERKGEGGEGEEGGLRFCSSLPVPRAHRHPPALSHVRFPPQKYPGVSQVLHQITNPAHHEDNTNSCWHWGEPLLRSICWVRTN